MTKEKHPLLLAVAAASLAAALAACDQAPAAGGPAVAPGAPSPEPAAPAAEQPGLRTETLIVAIVADEDDASLAATPAARADRSAATQTNVTATTTLKFPSDFGTPVRHRSGTLSFEYDFATQLPHAGITQAVIDRGGIIPWASVNGGASWHAGGFDLGGQLKLRFEYRAGDAEEQGSSGSVTITLAAIGLSPTDHTELGAQHAVSLVRAYLQSNPLLIRFFIITDQ